LDGKDLNGALADCNESLRLRPNDGNTLNSRGLVQFKVGAFDAAIADYNTAVAQNAKDADSLYARGVAKLKKGDTAGGNADIAAAKAIKPDIAVVSAGYGITVDAAGANAAPEHK
jgi:tetratricopeptide (TPR) repeat protein